MLYIAAGFVGVGRSNLRPILVRGYPDQFLDDVEGGASEGAAAGHLRDPAVGDSLSDARHWTSWATSESRRPTDQGGDAEADSTHEKGHADNDVIDFLAEATDTQSIRDILDVVEVCHEHKREEHGSETGEAPTPFDPCKREHSDCKHY